MSNFFYVFFETVWLLEKVWQLEKVWHLGKVWHIEKVWHLVILSLDFGSFFDWIYIVIWWFCKVGHESFVKSKFLLSFPSRAPMVTASRAEYAVLYWLAKYCFFNKIFDRNNRIAEQNQSQAHILYLFLKFHPSNVIGSVAQW